MNPSTLSTWLASAESARVEMIRSPSRRKGRVPRRAPTTPSTGFEATIAFSREAAPAGKPVLAHDAGSGMSVTTTTTLSAAAARATRVSRTATHFVNRRPNAVSDGSTVVANAGNPTTRT